LGQPSCDPIDPTCTNPGSNPTPFFPGSFPNAFSINYNCSTLTWTLDTTTLVIGNTTTCAGACCVGAPSTKYISYGKYRR